MEDASTAGARTDHRGSGRAAFVYKEEVGPMSQRIPMPSPPETVETDMPVETSTVARTADDAVMPGTARAMDADDARDPTRPAGDERSEEWRLVVALFETRDAARQAIHALRDHGVSEGRIDVLAADEREGRSVEDRDSRMADSDLGKDEGLSVTTAGDAAQGAATGAALGAGAGIAGALASIFVPGFGLVWASGVLAKALGVVALAMAGGAVAGGLAGYLIDLGVPSPEAEAYADGLRHGSILVAVHTCGEYPPDDIERIGDKYGGHRIGTFQVKEYRET
jgi:hypothetical protein